MPRTVTIATQRGVALGAILLGLLLPLVGGLLAPAHAVQTQPTEPSGGSPTNECAGLIYLDKFDWSDLDDGTGDFDQGDTTGGNTGGNAYSYSSSLGITITYTAIPETNNPGKFEVFNVSWTSTTPVDRVWEKAGHTDQSSDSGPYDEATSGSESVTGNAYSHLTWCYDQDPPQDPTVQVNGECNEVTVTITNPDQVPQFGVQVDIEQFSETIFATTSYTLDPGATLTASDGGSNQYGTFTWEDCSQPEPPTFDATPSCVDGTSTVTVTITNPDELDVLVEVFIDGVSQGTTSESGAYEGEAGQTLTVLPVARVLVIELEQTAFTAAADRPPLLAQADFADCFVPPPPPPPPPVPTTATFAATSECVDLAPVIDYVVDVTEGDDPFGTVTLTIADSGGTTLIEETLTGDAADTLQLPGRDGEVVTILWTFDDTTQELTLADNCATVLGVVEEVEADPAPEPEPEVQEVVVVADEELPAAGVTSSGLLVIGGAFLAFGCWLLLATRRRQGMLL